MNKVLLTGGNGFIGRAILNKLESFVDVVLVGRSKPIDDNPSINFVFKDICDISNTDIGYFKDVDVVIHCAALAHISNKDTRNPSDEFLRVNRDATLSLARVAAMANVKRFIFISSVGVNGKQTTKPFIESDLPNPHDLYSTSKNEAEKALFALSKDTDMEFVVIRPPLVYGPNAPGNFSSLVKIVNLGLPLPFGAVDNRRSYVALDNLVDFIVLCADKERSPDASNEIFLISDNEDISTSLLFKKVAHAYNVKPRLFPIPVTILKLFAKLLGKKKLSVSLLDNLQVDCSKAQKLLGWRPVTCMDKQLIKTMREENG
jgi:nucleoside-diphosphate-sugar epimerase